MMRDVDGIDTGTTLAGHAGSMPAELAPVGMAGMYARRGETQGGRAAKTVGFLFTTSTVGICHVEEVAAAMS